MNAMSSNYDNSGHNSYRIGFSDDEISRICAGLEKDRGEVAEMLQLLQSKINRKVGSDPDALDHWLRTFNTHLEDRPIDLLDTIVGFRKVVYYLSWLE